MVDKEWLQKVGERIADAADQRVPRTSDERRGYYRRRDDQIEHEREERRLRLAERQGDRAHRRELLWVLVALISVIADKLPGWIGG